MKVFNSALTATALLALMGMSHSAFAAPKALESTNTGSYGVAGCGLGSVVFGSQPGPIQIVAATLNGTGVQTFGITTGTSNCGPGLFAQRATDFVSSNKVALQNDVAKGDGETLASFEKLMNCKNSGFASELKANYESIFANDTDRAIAEAMIAHCQI
jgi:hypothetical protein